MNILGPKNIAKKFLSYIDPFDNCVIMFFVGFSGQFLDSFFDDFLDDFFEIWMEQLLDLLADFLMSWTWTIFLISELYDRSSFDLFILHVWKTEYFRKNEQ